MDELLFQTGSFVDHFRIMRSLGRGGMGEVYLARDTKLGRKAALKIIHPERFGKSDAVERFLFEARITARFSHPHIVTIYAVGECGDRPYLALEYLEGQTLRERMVGEALTVRETLRLGLAIAQALEEAHGHKILHRDLKPENVLLPRDGRLRVVDFGLAKRLNVSMNPTGEAAGSPGKSRAHGDIGRESAALLETAEFDPGREDTDELNAMAEETESGPGLDSHGHGVRGTPAYMAPEQWEEKEATAASDVWALGLILYEMLAGRRPYSETFPMAIAVRVCAQEAVPDIERHREVPGRLADLVAGCLNKKAADRLTAAEIVRELTQLRHGDRGTRSETDSPFRGLLPFSERHADLFFGREAEVGALVERLRDEPLLAVVGPSGAGKSSFVKAGVIPRLRDQGRWLVLSFRPGNDPFVALAGRLEAGAAQRSEPGFPSPRASGDHIPVVGDLEAALAAHGGQNEDLDATQQLAATLRESPLRLNLHLQRLAESTGSRVLVYVDQLEELYTLGASEETRHRFMEALHAAADDPQEPVRVVVSLRDDFLGRLADSPAAREALSRVAAVRSPELEGLTEILEKPLEAVGYRYEDPNQVQVMLDAVRGEPACLPLLQFTCHELWSRRDRARQLITRRTYDEIGGVAGALARHADGVLAGLTPDRLELARQLLLRLVTADSTRQVVTLTELIDGLGKAAREVLEHLAAERIVSLRRARSAQGSVAELELAHESLIHTWDQLAHWLDESREDRAFLEQVGQAAALWEGRGRRRVEVWDGSALEEASKLLARCADEVPARVRRFLEASEGEARRARRRRRILRVGGVATLVVIAVISAMVAAIIYGKSAEVRRQRDQAKVAKQHEERKRAESDRESAGAALMRRDMVEARAKLRTSLERSDDPLARALWARFSREPLVWKRELGSSIHHSTFSPDGQTVAAAAGRSVYLFDTSTLSMRALRGHSGLATYVVFSPTADNLAVATYDGRVWIWNHRQSRVLRRLRGHKGPVWMVKYGPQGKVVATAGDDGTVRIWDVDTGRCVQVYRGHGASCPAVRFSRDGAWLASASFDGTVQLWRRGEAQPFQTLKAGAVELSSVAISPSGRRVAAAGLDGVIRIWRVTDGQLVNRIDAHTRRVNAVSFSPDGRLLASSSADRTVKLWDVSTGGHLRTLRGHKAAVWSVCFSPDGAALVSAGIDRTIRVFSIPVAIRAQASTAHKSAALSVAFSPAGTLLASSSYDDTVRLWDVASGRVVRILRGHEGDVYGVVFSADGRRLASVGSDRTVRIWDVKTGAVLKVLRHPDTLRGVALDPQGKLLAAAVGDRTVHVWDLEKFDRLFVLRGFKSGVWGVAFSPDGKVLANGSYRGRIQLWDSETGHQRRSLEAHTGNVWGLQFTADGRRLISGSWDKTVRSWDLDTGKSIVVGRYQGRVNRLSVAPDGGVVAVPLGSGTAVLQPLGAGKRRVLRGHRKEVNGAAFSPDGRLVATASDDG